MCWGPNEAGPSLGTRLVQWSYRLEDVSEEGLESPSFSSSVPPPEAFHVHKVEGTYLQSHRQGQSQVCNERAESWMWEYVVSLSVSFSTPKASVWRDWGSSWACNRWDGGQKFQNLLGPALGLGLTLPAFH